MSQALRIVNRLLENDEADEFIERELVDKPLPKEVKLVGRRFFKRSKGTTWHTCEIWADGKLIGKTDTHSGYGQQYEETGLAWMEDKMIMPRRPPNQTIPPWTWFVEHGVTVTSQAIDVKNAGQL